MSGYKFVGLTNSLNREANTKAAPKSPAAKMNKWERQYADRLQAAVLAGEIKSYRFEAVKLRLANATFYTPDFMLMRNDGAIEFHEVKGFWRDDARVKIKVAAEQYRDTFHFLAVTKKRSDWIYEAF